MSSLTSVLVNSQIASLTGQTTQLGDFDTLIQITPSGGNVDVTSMVQLDSDRGIVKDIQNRYRHQYVQITYQAGFPPDTTNPTTSYLLSAVPDWLQQAAKLAAMLGLADSAPIVEANLKIDKQLLGMRYTSLVSRKMRYAPLSRLPI